MLFRSDAETDFSSALMWASLAADNKGEGDADDAAELRTKQRMKNAQGLPCC